MKLRIGALSQNRSGVEHLVAGFEQSDVGADRIDHAGGVIAQNLVLAWFRRGALAHLGIDRIDRHGFDGNADVAAGRLGLVGGEID